VVAEPWDGLWDFWPCNRRAGAFAPALTCTFSGGGGPIYAIATTESVTVPVDAVLWLDNESVA